jgi:hypothetical protein
MILPQITSIIKTINIKEMKIKLWKLMNKKTIMIKIIAICHLSTEKMMIFSSRINKYLHLKSKNNSQRNIFKLLFKIYRPLLKLKLNKI